MNIEFNTNIELLMGGQFNGHSCWNKKSSSVDNCYKIYYVKKGKASVVEKKCPYELKEGHIYFINGYKIDSQKSIEPFSVQWVHFRPKSLYLNHILKRAHMVTTLNTEEFSSFMECFSGIENFFNKQLDSKDYKNTLLETQVLIQFVIAKIFRQYNTGKKENDENFTRIFPALEYIADNYKNPLSLNELAQKCHLSPNYFHRLFSEIFDLSPLKYIQDLRMNEAVRQLTYTTTPVKIISYNVGYDDAAYFSRLFSKLYGKSPGVFRRMHRDNIP